VRISGHYIVKELNFLGKKHVITNQLVRIAIYTTIKQFYTVHLLIYFIYNRIIHKVHRYAD